MLEFRVRVRVFDIVIRLVVRCIDCVAVVQASLSRLTVVIAMSVTITVMVNIAFIFCLFVCGGWS